MKKLILVQLDGLRYTTARRCLGWPEAMVRANKAQVFSITAELPSLSRPLYETLLTGQAPIEHGVVLNQICRRSRCESLFDRVRSAGGRATAAAYHWIAKLYLNAPFNPKTSRLILNGGGAITDGFFYWDETYPDSHLFADAQFLIDRGADFYCFIR